MARIGLMAMLCSKWLEQLRSIPNGNAPIALDAAAELGRLFQVFTIRLSAVWIKILGFLGLSHHSIVLQR